MRMWEASLVLLEGLGQNEQTWRVLTTALLKIGDGKGLN